MCQILYENLQNLINEIDKNRDELEQDYYRKKIQLTTAYETKTWTLLEIKSWLKKILREYQENLIEKDD